ncbi:FAD-dependent oxidoreductase [Metabacillus litoralis]|uniref:FAD-dependent oxidoreductase n=1 Tax=Metabacillus litoralis TaxID=152268 RepID=UPI001CFCA1C0|nr:NAD(P)/FAD-dependent oxidoreductase [Metabacillus litoralis]
MNTDVLIIGGGVGGLTVALRLAMCGIDVTVVEQQKGNSHMYKGELLQPKSLEIFQRLNIADEIRDNGHPLHSITVEEMKYKSGIYQNTRKSKMDYRVINTPYNYGLMIPHEKLKEILLKKSKKFSTFHYYQPARFTEFIDQDTALIDYNGTTLQMNAKVFVGAEGRRSKVRKHIGIDGEEHTYDHHFLTVNFPRPDDLTEGKMISTKDTFLGLFPLPNNQVRSVYLIPSGEYKAIKEQGIEAFFEKVISLSPELDRYVNQIPSWRNIQLMIPFQFHANSYSKGNKVIIGDAAHNVHPMAGEGMNLAIQDGDALGDLICWMEEQNRFSIKQLNWFEQVRKPRVKHLLSISHLAALAYSKPFRYFTRIRGRGFQQMEHDDMLHYKQMLNISGLGMWKESFYERLIQIGLLPTRSFQSVQMLQSDTLFTSKDDYPWRYQGGVEK